MAMSPGSRSGSLPYPCWENGGSVENEGHFLRRSFSMNDGGGGFVDSPSAVVGSPSKFDALEGLMRSKIAQQQRLAAAPYNRYGKSYCHYDVVTHVAVSPAGFFITGSYDGHLMFWKKQPIGIEFAKHFKAHLGPIEGLAVMLHLDFTPGAINPLNSSRSQVKMKHDLH